MKEYKYVIIGHYMTEINKVFEEGWIPLRETACSCGNGGKYGEDTPKRFWLCVLERDKNVNNLRREE